MKFDVNNEDLVGRSTPDPLRFAFTRKKSPHAGAMMQTIKEDAIQASLQKAHASSSEIYFRRKDLSKPPSIFSHVGSARCLYLHVPFCRVRCTYCHFFQYASSSSLMDDYVKALREEMRWKASTVWAQSAPFHAVYIGGGTPTDLSAEQIYTLVSDIRALFPLTPDCEITLEGRVNRFELDQFESALTAGVNRFSFGVQSFNTLVRKSAKRQDTKEDVMKKIQLLSSYQAAPIVLDLLYGLPYQTLEIWEEDLQGYLESGAQGVDLYQLIELNGLPMAKMVEQGKLPPPADTQMKASMFEMGVNFMAKHHQTRLSVNHWSSNHRERSLYNTLAKTSAEIMPLGAGAGGNVNGYQMMQTRDMKTYIDAIKNKVFPVTTLSRVPSSKGVSSEIKSGFDSGVLAQSQLDKAAGAGTFEALSPLFEAWQKNGLVHLERHQAQRSYLKLTLAGQFWTVNLAQNLIDVLRTQKAPAL